MQILLAEDNETNRKVATKLAESLGHSVDVVENGFDAVEKARDGNYDVILMDVQMPIVDGREATRRIRNEFRDAGGGPRIIAVTANVLVVPGNIDVKPVTMTRVSSGSSLSMT